MPILNELFSVHPSKFIILIKFKIFMIPINIIYYHNII